ncbi:MAG: DUF3024 domain-containing protein [Gaiellaceae bacterium]
MAVPEDALAQVARFCEERTTPELRNQLRLECSGRGDAITIVEQHAPWNPDLDIEWTTSPVARLRHDARAGTWTLDWRGSDERWHRYEDTKPSPDVQPLLAEIETDPTGIFWG